MIDSGVCSLRAGSEADRRFPGLPCIEYKQSAAKPATRISGVTLHITCIDKGDPILLQAVDSGPGVQIIRSEGDPSNLCVDLRVSPVHIDKSHRFRERSEEHTSELQSRGPLVC